MPIRDPVHMIGVAADFILKEEITMVSETRVMSTEISVYRERDAVSLATGFDDSPGYAPFAEV